MKATLILCTAFAVVALSLSISHGAVSPSLREEGLYISETASKPTVQNFLSHFTYEGLYRSRDSYWTTGNNVGPAGVDTYDFVYYCGHGCAPNGGNYGWFGIYNYNGGCIDLLNAGNNYSHGYGDKRLKYLVLHSCETVASPFEGYDVVEKWLAEPGSIFDGLHILMGFRTQTSQDNGLNIADEMGRLLIEDDSTLIVWNWMNAVETYGDQYDPWLDEYSMYTAYLHNHFYEAAYSSFWDVYGGSQSGSYDSPDLYAIYSYPH